MFLDKDCSMIEINPLVKSESGEIIALDGKVSFDDSADFRHPWRNDLRDLTEEEEVEIRANKFSQNIIIYLYISFDLKALNSTIFKHLF